MSTWFTGVAWGPFKAGLEFIEANGGRMVNMVPEKDRAKERKKNREATGFTEREETARAVKKENQSGMPYLGGVMQKSVHQRRSCIFI